MAVAVTRDVLRRPAFAARLMDDTATRQAVTEAQKPEHHAETPPPPRSGPSLRRGAVGISRSPGKRSTDHM
ncbi:hypothetical protein [Streptomyces sp. V1I1]|uniref:hypothetical protein n=1 Tax=Streptomyces sp. V1I1 TaxID=3042272 RepID=UPI00278A9D1C|nr:hypothetical protein [Streptomyces sp. V1I1]